MSPLWTAAALRAATGGRLPGDVVALGVSIDSRSISPGDLFIALRDQRDGHAFVADALARGAACAMVDHPPTAVAAGAPLLQVANTLAGFTALGAAGRARSQARCVAITGSVGKTTTKDMLAHGLSASGPTHASAASHNNQWGVPLTLARLPPDAAFAVIEIGMNHRGEIAPLARLARPEVAVITAIAPAHIGHLGGIAAIVEEKADILLGLPEGGIAILPGDTPHFPRLAARAAAAGARVMAFGEGADAAARLVEWQGDAESSRAQLSLAGAQFELRLAAPGKHLALNATAALAAAVALGADPGRFIAALGFFQPAAGRGHRRTLRLPDGAALLLDESYNASTTSVRAALAVLAAQPAKRRIVVLGDMLELGAFGPALHAELAPDVTGVADQVFCCGPLMRHLFDRLPLALQAAHAADSSSLAPRVAQALRAGDAVLVKGSLGMRMATIIAALTAGTAGAAA